MLQVAVLGYGTVGNGVVEVLFKNAELIEKRVGEKLNVKAVLDLRDFPGDIHEDLIVHDVDVIINDPEIKIVCEAMGGTGPAYKFTKAALEAGKSVCTSNKELVAKYGAELIEIAKAHNCSYKFEASVGGGIPIIRPLNEALTGDKVESICAIINGTTNYMLTKMAKEGADFDEVLKEAQAKGYAELHPEADVEGFDACRKIAILSSLVYQKTVNYEKVHTEGITAISSRDFKYAKQLNRNVKLIAKYEDAPTGAYAMVAPFMLSEENPLYHVDDVFNAVLVHGNMVDDVMFYGKGAGKLPTASAVVSDVVECAKHPGVFAESNWKNEEAVLGGFEASKKQFFVRVGAELKREAEAAFENVTEVNVGFYDEFAFITEVLSEADFARKCEKTGKIINFIRLEK